MFRGHNEGPRQTADSKSRDQTGLHAHLHPELLFAEEEHGEAAEHAQQNSPPQRAE